MKSFRATWWLALVIGALVGYAVYDFRQEEKKNLQQAESEKIVPFSIDDLVEVTVQRKDEKLRFKKNENTWQMLEPVVDEVENMTISEYLNSLAIETGSAMPANKNGAVDWQEYSLQEPLIVFEFTKKDGSKILLSVSNQVAFDGNYYLRRRDSAQDQLILGSSGWARIAEKSSRQLRDKRLWRQPTDVDRLTIELNQPQTKDKVTLVRQEKVWKIEGAKFAVDSQKVERYIEDLKEIRGLEFANQDLNPNDLKKMGLDKAKTRIVLETAKKDQSPSLFVIELGDESGGGVYSKTSSVPAVLRIAISDAEKLKQGRMDFRDGKAPFQLKVDQVQTVQVKEGKTVQTFKRAVPEWQLENGNAGETVDSENLQKLFEKIGNLEAKQYFPPTQKVGAIQQTLEFQDNQGKSLLALKVGEGFSPKDGKNKNALLTYVQLNSNPEILAVLSHDLQELKLNSLIKKTNVPKPSEVK